MNHFTAGEHPTEVPRPSDKGKVIANSQSPLANPSDEDANVNVNP